MEWSFYAEIYDPIDAPRHAALAPPVYRGERIAGTRVRVRTGVAPVALEGGAGRACSRGRRGRVALFQNGKDPIADSGLEATARCSLRRAGRFR